MNANGNTDGKRTAGKTAAFPSRSYIIFRHSSFVNSRNEKKSFFCSNGIVCGEHFFEIPKKQREKVDAVLLRQRDADSGGSSGRGRDAEREQHFIPDGTFAAACRIRVVDILPDIPQNFFLIFGPGGKNEDRAVNGKGRSGPEGKSENDPSGIFPQRFGTGIHPGIRKKNAGQNGVVRKQGEGGFQRGIRTGGNTGKTPDGRFGGKQERSVAAEHQSGVSRVPGCGGGRRFRAFEQKKSPARFLFFLPDVLHAAGPVGIFPDPGAQILFPQSGADQQRGVVAAEEKDGFFRFLLLPDVPQVIFKRRGQGKGVRARDFPEKRNGAKFFEIEKESGPDAVY